VKVKEFIEKRRNDGLSNASINRELASLKRMFNLAAQSTPPKVAQVPYISMLAERNVRKGFFEHDQFLTLRALLPDYVKPIATFAYHIGWRKEEILSLTWNKVDLKQGIVRLNPGETKNEEGRTIYLNEELAGMLRELFTKRQLGCPYVFQVNGRRVGDFKKCWNTACIQAGLSDLRRDGSGKAVPNRRGEVIQVSTRIFHDFRRTAVRNMIRAGVPERVAMTLSGHKTRSVFDRYNIVSEEDLKQAAMKQTVFLQSQANGYKMVTMAKKPPLRLSDSEGKSLISLVGHVGIEPTTY
jgi:integrase